MKNKTHFPTWFLALCLIPMLSAAADAGKVWIPTLSRPWTEITPILSNGWHSDFLLVKDKLSRWHAIGIGGQGKSDTTMFHAVGEDLTKPFSYIRRIESTDRDVTSMWAPFALWKDDTAYLFYCHRRKHGTESSMRLLTSQAPGLETWSEYSGGGLAHGNVVFADELGDRDPCVFWDEDLKCYLMYYACEVEGRNRVCVKTSSDLFHWANRRVAMECPPGYVAAESPLIVKTRGRYYMWISGFDYGRMSLYISDDPFSFGHPSTNRVMEQSGHAPEFATQNGVDYIACAAIASKRRGGPPGWCDLGGVYAQPVTWVEAQTNDPVSIQIFAEPVKSAGDTRLASAVTARLVDYRGNPVAKSGKSVTFAISKHKRSTELWAGGKTGGCDLKGVETRGQSFSAKGPFNKLCISAPSWGDSEGGFTLSLYRWTGEYAASVKGAPVAAKVFKDFPDNTRLEMPLDTQPAGQYVWQISDRTGTTSVGVWGFSGSRYSGGNAYANGILVPKLSYSSEIYYLDSALGEFAEKAQGIPATDGTATIHFIPGVDRETVEIIATCPGLVSDSASAFIDVNPDE